MKKWEYKSLEWIHKVRETNYAETKDKSLEKIIDSSVKSANKIVKELNLRSINDISVKTR